MAWFEYLKDNGFFNPSKNPKPQTDEKGRSSFAPWEAMQYLEKLSNSFERGELLNYVPEVITIIKNVSDDPVDNFLTWHSVLTIISRIPNEMVPLDIFNYMPVWTASNLNNSLISNSVLEVLLPKFLNGADDIGNREKSLVILNNIFKLNRVSPAKDNNNYFSMYDDYFVIEAFVNNKLIEKVAQHFWIRELRALPDAVGYILRDHISRPGFGTPREQYRLTGKSNFEQLHLSLQELDEEKDPSIVFEDVIDGYLDKGRTWQHEYFNDLFTKFNPVGESTDEILMRASFMLRHDFNSELNMEPISDLDKDLGLEPALNMTALTLREWLAYLSVHDPDKAVQEIKYLLNESRFDLTYFKRIIIFAISNNWPKLRSVFWEMNGALSEEQLFAIDNFKVDLTELLLKAGNQLDADDILRLKNIFDNGPVGLRHYASNPDYWRLRWYNALKDHPEFNTEYKRLKAIFKSEPDFASEGRVVIKSGYTSPLTTEELETLPVADIIEHLLTFETIDDWNGPDVEGFAHILGEAAERKPEKFINEIKKFNGIGFPYIYNLLFGIMQAFRKAGDFDLKPVIEFSERYIDDPKFWDNSLIMSGRPGTKKEWIYGQVADLISAAAKEDQDDYGAERIDLLIRLILKLISFLEETDRSRFKPGMDYIMYCLNSTQGKVIRTLLDVSLQDKRLRLFTGETDWNIDLKKAFENSMSAGILESYTVQSMFLQQLMFLDESWLQQLLFQNKDLSDEKWLAFMGGIAFKSAPINPVYYPLMLPHYERAVKNDQIDIHHEGGILRHLLAIYIQKDEVSWEDSLLHLALSKNNPLYTEKLISLINQQRAAVNKLDDSNKTRILNKVDIMWAYLLEQIKVLPPLTENGFKPIFRFIEFVDAGRLNEELSTRIIETVRASHSYGLNFLFKELQRLSSDPRNAKHIGRMLTEFEFNYYYEKDKLVSIIEYLYINGEKETTNAFVARLAQSGYDFLRPLYLKYNI